jgi:hypothetical protein
MRFDFGDMTFAVGRLGRSGLRLATATGTPRGPDKYRLLDLKRRRAQIRARCRLLQFEFADDDPRRTLGVTLVPPDAFAQPPSAFSLIVEQRSAPRADVVIEFGHISVCP